MVQMSYIETPTEKFWKTQSEINVTQVIRVAHVFEHSNLITFATCY